MNVSQGTSGQPEKGRIMEEEGKQKSRERRVRREETPKDSLTIEEWAMKAYLVFQRCLGNPKVHYSLLKLIGGKRDSEERRF